METFRRGWWGWTHSSEGYSVRLLGRTNLQYRDRYGALAIPAEAKSEPWTDIVVDTSAIPDLPEWPRLLVVDQLRRAFAFAEWTLIQQSDSSRDKLLEK